MSTYRFPYLEPIDDVDGSGAADSAGPIGPTGGASLPAAAIGGDAGQADSQSAVINQVHPQKDPSSALDDEPAREPRKALSERRGRPTTPLIALLVALVVAVLAGTGYFGLQVRGATQQDEERAEALQAARQLVVNLLTLDHNNPQVSLDQVLTGTTGAFREEFSSSTSSIQAVLQQAQVSSTGEVAAAGLAQIDEDIATVLVAATATVKNTETPAGEPRQYRMAVTLERHPEVPAGWLVSNVEFVP